MKDMRLLLLMLLTLLPASLVVRAEGSRPDTVTVIPSHHGYMSGSRHLTLATLLLPRGGDVEIRYELTPRTARLIDRCDLLVSDSLATRDLDDYRGRIPYDVVPQEGKDYARLTTDRRVLYLTADAVEDNLYSPSDRLEAKILSVKLDGREMPLKQEGDATLRQRWRTYIPLFVPGDTGSRNFRIPALLKTSRGTLLAFADRRKFNQGDIPEDIDLILRRSEDNGKSWSEPEIILRGQGRGAGYGDICAAETRDGEKVIITFVGGPGLWGSTADAPQPQYVMESTDDGLTWSEPRVMEPQLYGAACPDPERRHYAASFIASGHGATTCYGRVMFVAAMWDPERKAFDNRLVYSDDLGATWQVSEAAFDRGDEAKVLVMPDRSLLMSIRNPQRTERIFATSTNGGLTWTKTDKYAGLADVACNGALFLTPPNDGSRLMHTLPDGPGRQNGRLYTWTEGEGWDEGILLTPGLCAYTDALMLDDRTIAYIAEEDAEMSLVFYTINLNDLPLLRDR